VSHIKIIPNPTIININSTCEGKVMCSHLRWHKNYVAIWILIKSGQSGYLIKSRAILVTLQGTHSTGKMTWKFSLHGKHREFNNLETQKTQGIFMPSFQIYSIWGGCRPHYNFWTQYMEISLKYRKFDFEILWVPCLTWPCTQPNCY